MGEGCWERKKEGGRRHACEGTRGTRRGGGERENAPRWAGLQDEVLLRAVAAAELRDALGDAGGEAALGGARAQSGEQHGLVVEPGLEADAPPGRLHLRQGALDADEAPTLEGLHHLCALPGGR